MNVYWLTQDILDTISVCCHPPSSGPSYQPFYPDRGYVGCNSAEQWGYSHTVPCHRLSRSEMYRCRSTTSWGEHCAIVVSVAVVKRAKICMERRCFVQWRLWKRLKQDVSSITYKYLLTNNYASVLVKEGIFLLSQL
jgi:hypothetical protein